MQVVLGRTKQTRMSLIQIQISWKRILGYGKVNHLIIDGKKTACGHLVNGELGDYSMTKKCSLCSRLERQYSAYLLRDIEFS